MSTSAYQTHTDSDKHDQPFRNEPSPRIQQPPKGDLRGLMKQYDLPVVTRASATFGPTTRYEATKQASAVISNLDEAIFLDDAEALEDCFFAEQAFWKDQLAFTWHLRTFISPKNITHALLETQQQRDLTELFYSLGDAELVQIGPTLVSPWIMAQFVECELTSSVTHYL